MKHNLFSQLSRDLFQRRQQSYLPTHNYNATLTPIARWDLRVFYFPMNLSGFIKDMGVMLHDSKARSQQDLLSWTLTVETEPPGWEVPKQHKAATGQTTASAEVPAQSQHQLPEPDYTVFRWIPVFGYHQPLCLSSWGPRHWETVTNTPGGHSEVLITESRAL